MNKTIYRCLLYNGDAAFLLIIIITFGLVIISILGGRELGIPIGIAFPIIIFFFISPLIFKKKIVKYFTSDVILRITETSFIVSKLNKNKNKNTLNIEKIYELNTIDSYSFYVGQKTPIQTILTLHSKNGMPKSFNFIDKQFKDTKSFNEMFKSECLLILFYNQVKQYNTDKVEENKIQFLPSFFATKTGKIIIYLLAALIIAAIVLHLVIAPKSSFATLLISIGLVVGFFSKRKDSLELYKKIKELDKE